MLLDITDDNILTDEEVMELKDWLDCNEEFCNIYPFDKLKRIIENALNEVDEGLIEAAKSFGATKTQIIFKVMIKEAMPSIISGITLSVISILGYTAMAGTVGAGGLGKVALVYGHQRFDTAVMIYVVITLVIVVQAIQMLGDYAYKKLK